MNNNKVYTVYGINSSMSVINSTSCKIRQIVLTKNSNAFKSDKLNQEINRNHLEGKIKFVEYSKLNKNIGNRSQGVIIEFEFNGIKDTLEDLLKNDDAVLMCLFINSQVCTTPSSDKASAILRAL